MICCLVLKSANKCRSLFLSRQRQIDLSCHLEEFLAYRPFIFNTVNGVYIFVKKKEPFERVESIVINYMEESRINNIQIYNTQDKPHFFRNVIGYMLTSKNLSALGWKRFISSFLMQIDPFSRKAPTNNITVFKKFNSCVKHIGTKHQKKFFKKKLKMLRDRVSLESIERILEIE